MYAAYLFTTLIYQNSIHDGEKFVICNNRIFFPHVLVQDKD